MGIDILSTFQRTGVGNYPLIEDADLKGGFQIVSSTAARDAIQTALRKQGMHVYVTATSALWKLQADLLTWVPAVFAPGGGDVNEGLYTCPVGLAVNDIVYLSSADNCDAADADDALKQPVIGFVKDKPTATSATVKYGFELGGFVGLTAGSTYFLSTAPGQITLTPPSVAGAIVQRIGFAKNSTTLVIMVDRDFVIL